MNKVRSKADIEVQYDVISQDDNKHCLVFSSADLPLLDIMIGIHAISRDLDVLRLRCGVYDYCDVLNTYPEHFGLLRGLITGLQASFIEYMPVFYPRISYIGLTNSHYSVTPRILSVRREFSSWRALSIGIDHQFVKNRTHDDHHPNKYDLQKWTDKSITDGDHGFIYVLKGVGTDTYKIGLSKTPIKRIDRLGVVLPFPIQILTLIKTNHMRRAESYLHQFYAEKKRRGEWFRLNTEDVIDLQQTTHLYMMGVR